MPPWHNLQPLTPDSGLLSTPKALLCDPWTILNKWLSKSFYRMYLGKRGREGGQAYCPAVTYDSISSL